MNSLTFFLWNIHTILESLPISSSTHMQLIINHLAKHSSAASTISSKRKYPIESSMQAYFSATVQEIMHFPTVFIILGTLAYYSSSMHEIFALYSLASWFVAIIIADTVTGIAYGALKMFRPIQFPLIIGLCISASLLLSLYYCPISNTQSITVQHALIIGLSQACALLPGISRLATTIVTASWLGIDPLVGALFSLSIELPLIIAALAKALVRHPETVKQILTLSWSRIFILTATSIISCLLLIAVITLHMHGLLFLFGYYLLAITIALGAALILSI